MRGLGYNKEMRTKDCRCEDMDLEQQQLTITGLLVESPGFFYKLLNMQKNVRVFNIGKMCIAEKQINKLNIAD